MHVWSSHIDLHLGAYVPEQLFLEGKDSRSCRIFHDDTAVLDVRQNFSILASRGFEEPIGTPFCTALRLKPQDVTRLCSFLEAEDGCLLLGCGTQSLFFFSHWYHACGLCPVIRIHAPEAKIRNILTEAEAKAQHPIFSSESPVPKAPPLVLQLAEIFYYVDRIFDPQTPLSTHALTVANFVGCRLQHLHLPIRESRLTPEEFHRMTAFLVCLLLTLRHRAGRIEISEPMDTSKELFPLLHPTSPDGLRIEQHPYQSTSPSTTKQEHASTVDELPFLSLPAFRHFHISEKNGVWQFDLLFPKSAALSATPHSNIFSDLSTTGQLLHFTCEIEICEDIQLNQ